MSERIECDGCMCPACDDCFPQPETLNEHNRQERETRLRLEASRHPPLFVPTSHLERAQAKAAGFRKPK
jgi:hypothetical protein